ncbi:FUSC family protein [Streptomyces sp. S186]|uniref:FUSC family protein n=1 Tax=Streptomyces sp. S186 TaxID=3434395 RepID=UPI003F670EB4
MAGTRPYAPEWLVRVVRPRPAPIRWADVAHAVAVIVAPSVAGLLTGRVAEGAVVFLGALSGYIADRGGPLRKRVAHNVLGCCFGLAGWVVGLHVAGTTGWLPAVAFAALGGAGALIGVVNALLSASGFLLLIFACLGVGPSMPPVPVPAPLLFVCGGAWATAVSVLTCLAGGRRVPERQGVAEAYRAVGRLLGATGTDQVPQARSELADASRAAWETLTGARARSGGRDAEFRRLANLLNAATPVTDAAVRIARTRRSAPAGYQAWADTVADAVMRGLPPPAPPAPESGAAQDTAVRELRRACTTVADLPGRTPGSPGPAELLPVEPLWQRFTTRTGQVLGGHQTWEHVARMALCMATAQIVSSAAHLHRSYWVLLTTAIVLKPDAGSVFARGVQRCLGTLVGTGIGAAVLDLVPTGPLLLPFIAVYAAMLPIAMARNYGMFATFLTPLVVTSIDTGTRTGESLFATRLLDTLAGCAIALVLGYLLWPGTWRPRLGARMAEATRALRRYLDDALGDDPARGPAARRHTYNTLADLRTSLQRTLSEPPPISTTAAAWWPVVVQLERTADAITVTTTHCAGGCAADRHALHQLSRALDELAAALDHHHAPAPPDLPRYGLLHAVTQETETTYRLITDLDPTSSDRTP